MAENTMKVHSLIEKAFTAAVDKLNRDPEGNYISDLYVQIDKDNGELQIYDDEERLIEKVTIFDWANSDLDEEAFTKQAIATLKAVLTILSTKKAFECPRLLRPLSVSLTNESFIVIEELIYIDDDTLRLDDPLLKDLDEDLDKFLADLLSDVK